MDIPTDLRVLTAPCQLAAGVFPEGITVDDWERFEYSPTGQHFLNVSPNGQNGETHFSVFESSSLSRVVYLLFSAELDVRDINWDPSGFKILFNLVSSQGSPKGTSRVGILDLMTFTFTWQAPLKAYEEECRVAGLVPILREGEKRRAWSPRDLGLARIMHNKDFELYTPGAELVYSLYLREYIPMDTTSQYLAFSPTTAYCALVDPKCLRIFRTDHPALIDSIDLKMPLPERHPRVCVYWLPDGHRCLVLGDNDWWSSDLWHYYAVLYDVESQDITRGDFLADHIDKTVLGPASSRIDEEMDFDSSEVDWDSLSDEEEENFHLFETPTRITSPTLEPIPCRVSRPWKVHPAEELTFRPTNLLGKQWLYRPHIQEVGSEFILCGNFGVRLFKKPP